MNMYIYYYIETSRYASTTKIQFFLFISFIFIDLISTYSLNLSFAYMGQTE